MEQAIRLEVLLSEVAMICVDLNLSSPKDGSVFFQSLSDTKGFKVTGWVSGLSRSELAREEGNWMALALISKLTDD